VIVVFSTCMIMLLHVVALEGVGEEGKKCLKHREQKRRAAFTCDYVCLLVSHKLYDQVEQSAICAASERERSETPHRAPR
jgi:hypothetical protein